MLHVLGSAPVETTAARKNRRRNENHRCIQAAKRWEDYKSRGLCPMCQIPTQCKYLCQKCDAAHCYYVCAISGSIRVFIFKERNENVALPSWIDKYCVRFFHCPAFNETPVTLHTTA